jgi:uncharacterized protein (TIGR03066 family)
MKSLRFAFLGCLFAALIGCGPSTTGPRPGGSQQGSAPPTPAGGSNKERIIGKWEVVNKGGSAVRGTMFDFARDGKMSVIIGPPGMESVTRGTYALEGDKLIATADYGGGPTNQRLTITRLTNTEMTTTDDLEAGKLTEYRRK